MRSICRPFVENWQALTWKRHARPGMNVGELNWHERGDGKGDMKGRKGERREKKREQTNVKEHSEERKEQSKEKKRI